MSAYRLLQGDVRSCLADLPAASVHCAITSPPYYGLRDYGCEGQIGLETTPAEYLAKMVEVFAAVHRVLRDDGTLWINIGDSYTGSSVGQTSLRQPSQTSTKLSAGANAALGARVGVPEGFKPKDLMMIPARLAIALQEWGWYLRSDIIWAKVNPMPESVSDRPTSAHEHVFLLAKQPRYFYDADAIREPHTGEGVVDGVFTGSGGVNIGQWQPREKDGVARECFAMKDRQYNPSGRNKRNWWKIASQPYPDAHFATMPEALVEPCVLAGSSPRACEVCGASWSRSIESMPVLSVASHKGSTFTNGKTGHTQGERVGRGLRLEHRPVGWQPTCQCPQEGSGRCVVLDPFVGSGTTGVVSLRHNRDFIGIDLSIDYLKLAETRIQASLHESNVLDRPKVKMVEGQMPLWDDVEAPEPPVKDKQSHVGNRTYSGFNARWVAKEKAI